MMSTELPASAAVLTPPTIFADWWAMTEACSGHTGDYTKIQWYLVPGAQVNLKGAEVAGYYDLTAHRIVLTDSLAAYGAGVRHEMLHALLNVGGHPRDEFLGACRDVVECYNSCVTDAGPWTPPAPFVPLSAESLAVTSSVELRPPASDGQEWVVVHVNATNPLPRAVYAVPLGAQIVWGVSLTDHFYDQFFAADSSSFYFAANESRSWTYELRVTDQPASFTIAPGSYSIAGGFGQHLASFSQVLVPP